MSQPKKKEKRRSRQVIITEDWWPEEIVNFPPEGPKSLIPPKPAWRPEDAFHGPQDTDN